MSITNEQAADRSIGLQRLPRLLVRASEVGKMLGVSARHVEALAAQGLIPPPVRLGKCIRWSVSRLAEFSAAGCPPVRSEGPTA